MKVNYGRYSAWAPQWLASLKRFLWSGSSEIDRSRRVHRKIGTFWSVLHSRRMQGSKRTSALDCRSSSAICWAGGDSEGSGRATLTSPIQAQYGSEVAHYLNRPDRLDSILASVLLWHLESSLTERNHASCQRNDRVKYEQFINQFNRCINLPVKWIELLTQLW